MVLGAVSVVPFGFCLSCYVDWLKREAVLGWLGGGLVEGGRLLLYVEERVDTMVVIWKGEEG